jgi:hypothetical protein
MEACGAAVKFNVFTACRDYGESREKSRSHGQRMVCKAHADHQGAYPVWSSRFASLTSVYICLFIVTRESPPRCRHSVRRHHLQRLVRFHSRGLISLQKSQNYKASPVITVGMRVCRQWSEDSQSGPISSQRTLTRGLSLMKMAN